MELLSKRNAYLNVIFEELKSMEVTSVRSVPAGNSFGVPDITLSSKLLLQNFETTFKYL